MRKFLFISLVLLSMINIFSNGQAESGRASVTNVISSGGYVASSYLDLDSIIDDYRFPYDIEEDQSISFNIDASYGEYLIVGGPLDVQVAFKTNEIDFYHQSDINYVLFINDNDLLMNDEYISSIKDSLTQILLTRTEETQVSIFSMKNQTLEIISSIDSIENIIGKMIEEASHNNAESARDSRKDLEVLLGNLPDSALPYKILWLFNKPIAENEREFDDLFGIIAGLIDTDTEISFSGYNENFRVNTVNKVLDIFGGNSYYFEDSQELANLIYEDFQYYSFPVISDLDIKIYDLSNYSPGIIDQRFFKTIGYDENHTILSTLILPPYIAANQTSDISEERTKALVTISYYDHLTNKTMYFSEEIHIGYTSNFERMMESEEPIILRNKTIISTFQLISDIPDLLRREGYSATLIKITEQIEKLEDLNRLFNDSMISEDIELLISYREIIYQNKDDVFRSIQLFGDMKNKDF